MNLSLASDNGMGVVDFHGMTAIGIGGLPSDRTLAIWGERTTGWRDLDHWQRVWIDVRDGEAVGRCKIGDVTVDQARVMTVDADALGLWDDTKSHDGKADVVFWGRDATALAHETGANVIANESGTGIYGWLNLPESEAYSRASDLNALRSNERRFTVDFRPHTHQWNIMRDMRATPNSSGSLDFGHARVCMFATSWGDGTFPVEADLDVEGRVSRIRIEFGFDETGDQETRLKSVNEGASE